MIKKFLVTVMLMCAMSISTASVIRTENLTEAQVAELRARAAEVAAQNAKNSAKSVSPDTVTAGVTLAATWGTQAAAAAEGFAKALGIAAKELNVTINDFLASDAGKLTALLIIWHIAGKSIIGMIYALIVLGVGLTLVRIIYTRLFTKEFRVVQYSRFWGFWTGEKVIRIPKSFSDLRNDGEWFVFMVMLLVAGLTLIVTGVTLH